MHFYNNNESSEKEIKKTTSFIKASKPIKYIGINIHKKVKDFYLENYETVLKETKVHKNKWEDMFCFMGWKT